MYRLSSLVLLCGVCLTGTALAQTGMSVPVATTVLLQDGVVENGLAVIYDRELDTYSLATVVNDARVYGVTAERPVLVFSTSDDALPVVTNGVTTVRVSGVNGPIARGDLLMTSSEPGVSVLAGLEDEYVFAVALESWLASSTGVILAEVGVEQARARQLSRLEAVATAGMERRPISLARGLIAVVIAVGGLMFVLYSFRSVIKAGVVSIGRNPRARTAIMTLAIGNILFALVLCLLALFVAVAVLILPV
jgi:hypothetical protein